ncbi:NUDIX domain-containing protein [Halalkalibacter oceani]|uniref:NUDIX domain-containing protein n=1 Tax=Halalkalibacter oceani TaxID=1653776 RepID=UPI003D9CABBA
MRIDEIRPGVAMIVFNEHNDVLLQKRGDVGLWGLPSGHVELGETVEEAAIREMKEETNLHVEIVRLIGVYSEPESQVFVYPDQRAIHFVTVCFLVKVIGGKLKGDGEETIDVKYFPVDALPKQLLTMHPQWLSDALAGKEAAFIR